MNLNPSLYTAIRSFHMHLWIGGIRYLREPGFVFYRYRNNHFKIGTVALTAAAAYCLDKCPPIRDKVLTYSISEIKIVSLAVSISLVAQYIYVELNRWNLISGRGAYATWFQKHITTTLCISYITSSIIHLGILTLASRVTSVYSRFPFQRDIIALSAMALLMKISSQLMLPTQWVGREYRLPYLDVPEEDIHWREQAAILGLPLLNFFG